MMDIYSARKSITNSTLAYSVLNPDTSSDSPSAKSKGDRFASANTLTIISKARIETHATAATLFSCPML